MTKAQEFINLLNGSTGDQLLKQSRTLVDNSLKYVGFDTLPNDLKEIILKLDLRGKGQIYLLPDNIYKIICTDGKITDDLINLVSKNDKFIKYDKDGEVPYLLFRR